MGASQLKEMELMVVSVARRFDGGPGGAARGEGEGEWKRERERKRKKKREKGKEREREKECVYEQQLEGLINICS